MLLPRNMFFNDFPYTSCLGVNELVLKLTKIRPLNYTTIDLHVIIAYFTDLDKLVIWCAKLALF